MDFLQTRFRKRRRVGCAKTHSGKHPTEVGVAAKKARQVAETVHSLYLRNHKGKVLGIKNRGKPRVPHLQKTKPQMHSKNRILLLVFPKTPGKESSQVPTMRDGKPPRVGDLAHCHGGT